MISQLAIENHGQGLGIAALNAMRSHAAVKHLDVVVQDLRSAKYLQAVPWLTKRNDGAFVFCRTDHSSIIRRNSARELEVRRDGETVFRLTLDDRSEEGAFACFALDVSDDRLPTCYPDTFSPFLSLDPDHSVINLVAVDQNDNTVVIGETSDPWFAAALVRLSNALQLGSLHQSPTDLSDDDPKP